MGYNRSEKTTMSDIYDEKEDLKNVRSFTAFMRSEYQRLYQSNLLGNDPDTIRLRSTLATNWPGDELIQQIVKDVSHIMKTNNIKPGTIK